MCRWMLLPPCFKPSNQRDRLSAVSTLATLPAHTHAQQGRSATHESCTTLAHFFFFISWSNSHIAKLLLF
jgi:hypothetical protein